jgi:hypothetical protein
MRSHTTPRSFTHTANDTHTHPSLHTRCGHSWLFSNFTPHPRSCPILFTPVIQSCAVTQLFVSICVRLKRIFCRSSARPPSLYSFCFTLSPTKNCSEHGPPRVHLNAMQSLQPQATIDAAKVRICSRISTSTITHPTPCHFRGVPCRLFLCAQTRQILSLCQRQLDLEAKMHSR